MEPVHPKSSGFLLVCVETIEYERLQRAAMVGSAPESYCDKQKIIQSLRAKRDLEIH